MAVDLTWIAHSTFLGRTDEGVTFAIDPWFSENPVCVTPLPEHVDYVLLTHDHFDHVKDVGELARRGAKVVTQPETGERLVREEGAPEDSILAMNLGGTVELGDNLHVTMIPAFHTSNTGVPSGYIVECGHFHFVHAGDTALYSDMSLWGERGIDLALLPAGDHFTMGPRDAARAAKRFGVKTAVPIHYGTFPVLVQSPEPFVRALKELATGAKPWTPKPGESRSF